MAFKSFHFLSAVLLALCGLRIGDGAQGERSMVIHSMDIDCRITSRFARTFITTEIRNQLNSSQEAVFAVELPKTAFITNFIMTIDGVTNVGVVKKKAQADEDYRGAVSRGESAGLIQSTGRKMEHFKVSVNVGALATATFKLTYEELLKRHHGIYELQVKVRPQQLVEHFQIKVDVIEPQEITFVNAVGTFITNELTDTIEINHEKNKAHIVFKPTVDQQRKCPDCADTVLDGDFIVKYDVNRETSAGNIQIVNGYFVHYFAPTSLRRVPKNVVFVIDCSGSMRGRKLQQTFQAFTKILEDLPEEDHVGILKFNSEAAEWQKNLVQAIPENIKSAKEFVANIVASGTTNINSALLAAAEMLKHGRDKKILPEISASIIIFLSDGDPTEGVTNTNTIMRNVKETIDGLVTLYSLGFGSDLDYSFLEKMSLENGGLARRIYEDSDSALQLQNFYKEVAFPVLLDVKLQYPNILVSDLTQNSFRHYYQGSEIVVAGHVENSNVDILTAQVTAQGVSEQFSMNVETNIQEEDEAVREQRYIFGDFTERLWAYLTIEQLLSKQISVAGDVKQNITEEALSLCLKYNFVTPLTSMVITTSKEKNIVANKPKEDGVAAIVVTWDVHHVTGAVPFVKRNKAIQRADKTKAPNIPVSRQAATELKTPVEKVTRTDVGEDTGYTMRRSHSPILRTSWITLSDPLPVKTYWRTSSRRKPVLHSHISTIDVPSQTVKKIDCKHGPTLLSLPSVTEKICLGINEKPDTIIHLLHKSDRDITLNGRLAADNNSFDKFGLVLKKKTITIEITANNITVTTGQNTETYTWASAWQGIRFVKKEGNKFSVSLDTGFRAIISLAKNPDQLALYVQNQKRDLNNTTGLVGQLISDDKIQVQTDQIIVSGKTLPAQSSSLCDFSSYGVRPGPCVTVTVRTDDLLSGSSNILSDIFEVPHK